MKKHLTKIAILATMLMLSVSVASANTGSWWQATYWNNTELEGTPVLTRGERDLFHEWGRQSPAPGVVNVDGFSARWTRTVTLSAGTYEFKARADDMMRVWVDGQLIIDLWFLEREHDYINRPQLTLTGTAYMSQGNHEIVVEYVEFGDQATAEVTWDRILRDNTGGGAVAPATPVGNWRGEYYPNTNLRGDASFVREDAAIDFDWGTDGPADGWRKDAFSIRWTNDMRFSSGRYRFTVVADDGVRLFVNGKLLINDWSDGVTDSVTAEMTLPNGEVPVKLEYREGNGKARVHFSWVLVYPIGGASGAANDADAASPSPTLAQGTMKARTAVRQTFSESAPPINHADAGDVVRLAGHRSADSQWVRIVTPNNIWGWVPVDSLDTGYPISSLPVWNSDW